MIILLISIFTHKSIKSLKSLAANKEIIIVCEPEKGQFLDKAIYIRKITELIADRTKFETISDAPDK